MNFGHPIGRQFGFRKDHPSDYYQPEKHYNGIDYCLTFGDGRRSSHRQFLRRCDIPVSSLPFKMNLNQTCTMIYMKSHQDQDGTVYNVKESFCSPLLWPKQYVDVFVDDEELIK